MPKTREILHPKIKREAGDLIADLSESGWNVHSSQYSSQVFGNWSLVLRRGTQEITLVKERSQFTIDGPAELGLDAEPLRKAFNSFWEFHLAISSWATDLGKAAH
jgi:hypothetical protein